MGKMHQENLELKMLISLLIYIDIHFLKINQKKIKLVNINYKILIRKNVLKNVMVEQTPNNQKLILKVKIYLNLKIFI